jgi:hypothetical protein
MTTSAARPSASAPARIASDVAALARLGVERLALYGEERRGARRGATAQERARDLRWNATCAAAAVGAVASLPSSALLGVAASAIEAGVLADLGARAKARLGALAAGDDVGARGVAWLSDAGRAMVRAGVHASAKSVARRAASSVGTAALKELGLALPRLGLRAALGSAAPVVGAVWSGAWNAVEMHQRLTPAVQAVEAAVALAASAVVPAPVPGWTQAWAITPGRFPLRAPAAA